MVHALSFLDSFFYVLYSFVFLPFKIDIIYQWVRDSFFSNFPFSSRHPSVRSFFVSHHDSVATSACVSLIICPNKSQISVFTGFFFSYTLVVVSKMVDVSWIRMNLYHRYNHLKVNFLSLYYLHICKHLPTMTTTTSMT